MRKNYLGIVVLLLAGALNAAAQEPSKLDLSVHYSYIHARQVPSGGCCFQMNGGGISLTYYAKRSLGLEADIGSAYNGNVNGSGFNLNLTSYLFGPRISLHREQRWSPYGHVLFGGGHAGGTLYTRGFSVGSGSPAAQNAFMMAAGGGLEVALKRRFGLHLLQADWYFGKFPNGSQDRQNNLRLSAGIIFRFGSR
jgi:outer membrane immunogenic protein